MLSIVTVVLCWFYYVSPAIAADHSTTSELLWPLPVSMKFGSEVYSVDSSLTFLSSGAGATSNLLKGAFTRYQQLIFETPAPFYPSGASNNKTDGTLESLTVTVSSADETLGLDTDESYELSVTAGKGMMTAQTVFGALRGLETFSQLVYRTPSQMLAISEVTNIKDNPRFKYRGTMIDTARHYLNVKTILHHLDAMSYNKLNVLHWHIVDDQSFPYASKAFPNLTAQGAYDPLHTYSQEDISIVIAYALERGIRVIPEFDTPGHSKSWGHGQPNLLTPCYSKGSPDGSYGPINPTLNSTWTFMKTFYEEISRVFMDKYLHLGGDEVSYKCWESNPEVQAWMKKKGYTDYAKLEEYYENNLLDIVGNLNKSYVVWQEIFDNGLKIKSDTVIDVWKSGSWEKEMDSVTKAGYSAILSACWYLSRISLGPDWKNYYKCDPQNFNGTEQQNSLVVGGHACIWGEYVDSTNLLPRYWPRACAVAERLWSPKSVTDLQSASDRIHNQKCRLMSRGIPAELANGPSYCAFEWPGPN